MLRILILLVVLQNGAGEKSSTKYFDEVNNETKNINALGAKIAWDLALNPHNAELVEQSEHFEENYFTWQQSTCKKLESIQDETVLNKTQERMIYLLCRGPEYTLDEAKEVNMFLRQLQSIYAKAEICIPDSETPPRDNLSSIEEIIRNYLAISKLQGVMRKRYVFSSEGLKPHPDSMCLTGEADINRIMIFSRLEEVLNWIWESWHNSMSTMKYRYQKLVELQNRASLRSGYMNIGESWRTDFEIADLQELCEQLYKNIKPLYKLLHGVTRYFLRRKYGMIVPERGPIPPHLLGDLWAQNWEPLAGLILPITIDLDKEMKEGKVKWDVNHMLRRAEDFYTSLGLPPMTEAFWRESVFSRENHTRIRCHGTAADMFKDGDFRIIYCADVTFQDFRVLHHEMGHIQYYMAYEKQPGIFRQANAALHESIGDTIMYGVMTPQHLHRLGLVNDSVLYSQPEIEKELVINNISDIIKDVIEEDYESEESTVDPIEYMLGDMPDTENKEMKIIITADDILLLKQGLNKLPQIPFALAMDEYRWKYFDDDIDASEYNTEFWAIMEKFQGVAPSEKRSEYHFDVGAKFHVPNNTPLVSYFLSSFLQHQLFESLCKAAVYGQRNVKEPIPHSILIHRCDIYGSKTAGKLLRDIMSRGHSQSLSDILQATTGNPDISSTALERYYRPLQEVLQRIVDKYQIPLGW